MLLTRDISNLGPRVSIVDYQGRPTGCFCGHDASWTNDVLVTARHIYQKAWFRLVRRSGTAASGATSLASSGNYR